MALPSPVPPPVMRMRLLRRRSSRNIRVSDSSGAETIVNVNAG
jgi:hypothetical protein